MNIENSRGNMGFMKNLLYIFLVLLIACTSESREEGNSRQSVAQEGQDTSYSYPEDPSGPDPMPPLDDDTAGAGTEETTTPNEPEEVKSQADDQQDDEWTVGNTSFRSGGRATVTSVESGIHADFVRVVVEYKDSLPAYSIEYIDFPAYYCGSGKPFNPEGDGLLEVRMRKTLAHTEEGEPTISRTLEGKALINKIEVGCDFEGEVTLWLDVDAPVSYRAFTLQQPTRLVIDLER